MASITITIPDEDVQRVRNAFTFALDLEKLATVQDVKDYIVTDLKQFVKSAERRAAEAAVQSKSEVDFS